MVNLKQHIEEKHMVVHNVILSPHGCDNICYINDHQIKTGEINKSTMQFSMSESKKDHADINYEGETKIIEIRKEKCHT